MNQFANNDYPEYPVFKGLQRPLEFMGLRGRYIYWAASTAGAAILSFIIIYSLMGFAIGISMIIFKQMKGLHTKKVYHGILVYKRDSEI